jgi:hypothetical protein
MKSPKNIVSESSANSYKRVTWYDRLDKSGKKYVDQVVAETKKNPDAKIFIIARLLREELQLKHCTETIALTLKAMVNAK